MPQICSSVSLVFHRPRSPSPEPRTSGRSPSSIFADQSPKQPPGPTSPPRQTCRQHSATRLAHLHYPARGRQISIGRAVASQPPAISSLGGFRTPAISPEFAAPCVIGRHPKTFTKAGVRGATATWCQTYFRLTSLSVALGGICNPAFTRPAFRRAIRASFNCQVAQKACGSRSSSGDCAIAASSAAAASAEAPASAASDCERRLAQAAAEILAAHRRGIGLVVRTGIEVSERQGHVVPGRGCAG